MIDDYEFESINPHEDFKKGLHILKHNSIAENQELSCKTIQPNKLATDKNTGLYFLFLS